MLRASFPTYDVVIPSHNRAHVVGDAVASVLAQSRPASRIVVVDDASDDDGVDVIRSLARAHPSVVPLALPRNGGASAARNAGIAACGAEWTAFLDSDDLWLPDAAAALLGAGERDDLDVVVGDFARVERNGAVGPRERGWDGGDIRAALRERNVLGTSWSIVRRRTVHAAGGWDPSFRTCEDWRFFVDVAATGARFGRMDALVAHYRTAAGERLIADDADLAAGRLRMLAHPYLMADEPALTI
ncbi:glycosyltransferase family 2 protein [uncultured Sphingomonas sp.]|uniref:glycosyltransferase family 2 protein n=1 Tax=uncultured Sphingomonas sp. TaxID=158754 RepID=UPI0035CA3D03